MKNQKILTRTRRKTNRPRIEQQPIRASGLMTLEGVVAYTGLSRRKVQNDMAAGAIAYIKFGRSVRFSPEDVAAYVASRRIKRRSEKAV